MHLSTTTLIVLLATVTLIESSPINTPVRTDLTQVASRKLVASTVYKIIVENRSPRDQNVYFFQDRARYTGGPEVFTNSMGTVFLRGAQDNRTDQAQFTVEVQYRAGAQRQLKRPGPGVVQSGKVSTVLVTPRSPSSGTGDATEMIIDVSGNADLSLPTEDPHVPFGSFRISTPVFQPGAGMFNVGTATQATVDGVPTLLMSNFITAPPNAFVDVQPVVKFYVNAGNFVPGENVNFSTEVRKSAVCDATGGQTSFFVIYKPNGTWTVQ